MTFKHHFTSMKRTATALFLPVGVVLVLGSCSDATAPELDLDGESAVPYITVPLQSLYSMSAEAFAATAIEAADDASAGVRWCGHSGVWFDPSGALCNGHGQAPPYGSVTEEEGELVIAAATSKAGPFLWTGPPERVNPFPSSGDFTLDIRMKVDNPGVFGAGLHVGSWDPAVTEGSSNPGANRVFHVWSDRAAGMWVRLLGVQFRVTAWRDWYTYRVVYEDGAYSLFVNEQWVAGPIPSDRIPTAIWMGNPAFQTAARDWTDLRVAQVTVSAATAEVLAVPFDIKPGGCPTPLNVRARGVLPVAIAGTADFDVSQIDPSTLRLETVAPERSAVEDVATPVVPYTGKTGEACTAEGADGHEDLTVKFSNQAVVEALSEALEGVEDGGELTLKLSGSLWPDFGGTAIEGEDVVVVRK